MGYSKEIHQAVKVKLDKLREDAIQSCEQRKQQFFKMYPKAREIEYLLSKTSLNTAKAVLSGKDSKLLLEKLKKENLRLQENLHKILVQAGVGDDYLEVKYHCDKCCDTGNIDGKVCSCAIQMMKQEAYKKISLASKLTLTSFESFNLEFYPKEALPGMTASPYKRMRNIYNFCVDYANNFTPFSKGLLLTGGTGLGKTHLSLAIAREVINKGYGVVYTSVPTLISQAEKEHFSYNPEQKDSTINHITNCDLLILDDLGTEFFSKFSLTAIYNIINSRTLSQLPTIINTNLSVLEIEENYSQRMVSRIIANCVKLDFIGRDIRQLKNQ